MLVHIGPGNLVTCSIITNLDLTVISTVAIEYFKVIKKGSLVEQLQLKDELSVIIYCTAGK